MLLLLLGRDVCLNPGPLTLGARSIRNKGPLLADIVASNDLDIFCLTETHVHPFDSDSFLQSITPSDFTFVFVLQVLVVVLVFSLDPSTDHIK